MGELHSKLLSSIPRVKEKSKLQNAALQAIEYRLEDALEAQELLSKYVTWLSELYEKRKREVEESVNAIAPDSKTDVDSVE